MTPPAGPRVVSPGLPGLAPAYPPDLTRRREALAAAGQQPNPELSALARGLGEWGAAVSAQLTAAFRPVLEAYAAAGARLFRDLAPLAELAAQPRGARAQAGDPCGNPHPPFTGRPPAPGSATCSQETLRSRAG